MPRETLIQIRRGSSSDWLNQNPILDDGELGFEIDTNRLKIGNGEDNWNELSYIGSSENTIKVINNSGYAFNKGQALYLSGYDTVYNIPIVNLYRANNELSEQKFIGLLSSYMSDGELGFAINFGILSDINTTGDVSNICVGDETWSNGDILYVSPYDYGKLTNIKPNKNIILVGIVINANVSGSILIRSFINPKFNQLNGININNVIDSHILKYENSSDAWINSNDIDCGLV